MENKKIDLQVQRVFLRDYLNSDFNLKVNSSLVFSISVVC